jgi:hypothetical protein
VTPPVGTPVHTTTLAYVFWHAPGADVSPAEYESGLAGFHRSLATSGPKGFLASASYRASRLPWDDAGFGPVVYVDWYLVDSWAALGELNHDAVAPPHHGPHDAVAGLLGRATGGIYRLRHGGPELQRIRFEGWAPKPSGVSSETFIATLVPSEGSLWQRQLALGPGPEFCRRTRMAPSLAPEEHRVEVRPVAIPPSE